MMSTSLDPRLTRIAIAHLKDYAVGAQTVDLFGSDETVITRSFLLHDLILPADGPDKDVLACPVCGAAIFEVERTRGLLVAWKDCGQDLQAWLRSYFAAFNHVSPWQRVAGATLGLVATAVLLVCGWIVVSHLATGTSANVFDLPGFRSAMFFGVLAVFGALGGFGLATSFGRSWRPSLDAGKSFASELFWIDERSGAPIGEYSGFVRHVYRLGKARTERTISDTHYYSPLRDSIEENLGIKRICWVLGLRVDWAIGYPAKVARVMRQVGERDAV